MTKPLTHLETIKRESNFLRGTIAECLKNPVTGAIIEADSKLTKFHGFYMQDDRDLRDERRKQKLEPDYQYFIRARLPGGVLSAEQWLALDELVDIYARGTLKLTTRQTFQFHGIRKHNLKNFIQGMGEIFLDSIAACGDVNRNVICAANPHLSQHHKTLLETAQSLSNYLKPKTHAYQEVFLDAEPVAAGTESEPMYGETYLPRKFKIALTIPPDNDIDVFAHDLGYVAIIENNQLVGYTFTVGGGMGKTYGDDRTYPRAGSVIGFITPEKIHEVSRTIIEIQRDNGDRTDRHQARIKYTLDRMGIDGFKAELNKRLGYEIEPARPFVFENNGDRYGWVEGEDGLWHLTLYIEAGKIYDKAMKQGIREIVQLHNGEIRLTTNQNMIFARVKADDRAKIDALVEKHGLDGYKRVSAVRKNSIACVALPTCGLAMAESERYLPDFLTRLENSLDKVGLLNEPLVVRISGCPNGCSRPYLAEIALTGRAIGRYNLNLGGTFAGEKTNQVYLENATEDEIFAALDPLLASFAKERQAGEHFSDYLYRSGVLKA